MIDVETARTFLAIATTGTFQAAAKQVNVTQSTVSARIKTLEVRLGQKVFDRSKSGAALNHHGRQFERYARAIVQAWEQGKRKVAEGKAFDSSLAIGGQPNLWTRFLSHWLLELQSALPETTFRAEASGPAELLTRVSDGALDVAVTHETSTFAGIDNLPLMKDELVLVTTDAYGEFEDRYVFLDWGDAFRAFHDRALPGIAPVRVSAALGYFGVRYLLLAQGAGFVPRRLVEPHLEAGYLHCVADAPTFEYPVYLAMRSRSSNPAMKVAISVLRDLAVVAESGELPAPFWARSD